MDPFAHLPYLRDDKADSGEATHLGPTVSALPSHTGAPFSDTEEKTVPWP